MERIIQVIYISISIYIHVCVYYHFLVVYGQPYTAARYNVNLVYIPSTCILMYKQWFPVCTEPSHYLGKYSSKKYEIAFPSMRMKYHWTEVSLNKIEIIDPYSTGYFFLKMKSYLMILVSKTVIYFVCWKLVKYKVYLGHTVGAEGLMLQHQGICSCSVDYTQMCLKMFMG